MFINKTGNLSTVFVYDDEHCFCTNYRESAKQAFARDIKKRLEKASDYKFFYNESLPDEKIVSLQLPMPAFALKFCFWAQVSNTGRVRRTHHRVSRKECASEGQQVSAQSRKRPVKGRVADTSGEPVTGVTIIEKANP